jgi:hypothetical protein
MNELKNFMWGYLNISMHIKLLNDYIYDFKYEENKDTLNNLIKELEDIMENSKYDKAIKIIRRYGGRIFSKRFTEEFIRYLHARMKNKKPRLTLEELLKVR